MPSPARNLLARKGRPRGAIYLTVLVTSTLVVTIALAALATVRIQRRGAETEYEIVQARAYAEAGVEFLAEAIARTPGWRSEFPATLWDARQLGAATLTLSLSDPADGDLADSPCDPLLATAEVNLGQARRVFAVQLEPAAAAADPLRDAILSLHPLAYWRFGAAGSVVAEENGLFPGLFRNGAQAGATVPHSCDGGLLLDGSNDYAEIPHSDLFLIDQGSIQLWFNATSTADQGLFSKQSGGYDSGGEVILMIRYGRVHVLLESRSASYTESSDSITSGAWHHVVFTFGPSGMQLYIDGDRAGYGLYTGGWGASSGGIGNTEPIAIGVSTVNSTDGLTTPFENPFAGIIDEVALFDYELTWSNVQTLYNAGSASLPHTVTISPGTWQRIVAP